MFEKLFRFFVRLGGGNESNIETSRFFDLVVNDFREDELFFHTEGVVTPAVKRITGNAAEVSDSWQSDGNEFIHKLVHSRRTERNLAADVLSFSDFKVSDGLSRLRDDGTLTGNSLDFVYCNLKTLCVVFNVTQTGVDNDFSSLGTWLTFL